MTVPNSMTSYRVAWRSFNCLEIYYREKINVHSHSYIRLMIQYLLTSNNKPSINKCIISLFNCKKNLRGFGTLANYAERATAASWRSSTNFSG
jgi:hypothetical protein